MSRGYINPRTVHVNDTGRPDPYADADNRLGQAIKQILWNHYPAHPWEITVEHSQGIAYIKLPHLLNKKGWMLHINKLTSYAVTERYVMRAGGELLELANMSAGGFRPDQFTDAMKKTPIGRARAMARQRRTVESDVQFKMHPAGRPEEAKLIIPS